MITYEPSKILDKLASKKKIKRLVTGSFSLKKSALTFVDSIDGVSKKSVARVALKTIKGYKKRIKEDPSIKSDILEDPKQLVQRVQNEVVLSISEEIKDTYHGEQYEWLPSDAEEPDPEHQLNYGKTFTIGEGEMPGERIGCRCGMNILVKETKLDL